MTHSELVERAGRWLRNTKKCKLVLLERKPWNCSEHPDAIGWTPDGESLVVECKVSMSDFKADWNKKWRAVSLGMGFKRYYMTPPFLLTSPTGPRLTYTQGAGILEVHGRTVKVCVEASPRQQRDFIAETNMLVAHICQDKPPHPIQER